MVNEGEILERLWEHRHEFASPTRRLSALRPYDWGNKLKACFRSSMSQPMRAPSWSLRSTSRHPQAG